MEGTDADAPKEKIVPRVHQLAVDAELVRLMRQFVLESATDNTPSHRLTVKMYEDVINQSPRAACGAFLMNMIWLAQQLADDLKLDERVVLASMCFSMLQLQANIHERKGFSSN